jgi:hypothetical protein
MDRTTHVERLLVYINSHSLAIPSSLQHHKPSLFKIKRSTYRCNGSGASPVYQISTLQSFNRNPHSATSCCSWTSQNSRCLGLCASRTIKIQKYRNLAECVKLPGTGDDQTFLWRYTGIDVFLLLSLHTITHSFSSYRLPKPSIDSLMRTRSYENPVKSAL